MWGLREQKLHGLIGEDANVLSRATESNLTWKKLLCFITIKEGKDM